MEAAKKKKSATADMGEKEARADGKRRIFARGENERTHNLRCVRLEGGTEGNGMQCLVVRSNRPARAGDVVAKCDLKPN
jgi:hypothetical protein